MANGDDCKKYKPLEQVLIRINRDIISLSEVEVKRNRAILKSLMKDLLPEMKRNDPLFNEMFTEVFYGGSFYDKLRVKEPNEFDLDLLLRLPKLSQPKLILDNDVPGYTTLKLKNLSALNKQADMAKRYSGFSKLLENEKDCYLDNNKVRRWMERVVTLALNTFSMSYGNYYIQLLNTAFIVKVHKSGPAFTLKLRGEIDGEIIAMCIDLVPCFEFDVENLPVEKLMYGNCQKKTFFVVPKPMKIEYYVVPNNNRYWRLSYQEQERELMERKNHQYLKPTIKLLKKLKEKEHPFISSYFIKTVVLWEAEEREYEPNYWGTSLSYVFMTCLKKYYKYIEQKNIPYYWNENYNLLQCTSSIALENLKYRLSSIIGDIDRNLLAGNPNIIEKYLLTDNEKFLLQVRNEKSCIAEEPGSTCIIL